MKHRIRFLTSSILVAVMAFALAGVAPVQAAANTNQIVVENQTVDSGVVVIDSVTAAQDGWVVLYKNPNLDSSEIVGHAWVHAGVNEGVKVTVDMSAINNPPTLWAAFLADSTEPSVRQNWGPSGLPGSAAQSTPAAVTAFATTGNAGVVPTSAKPITDSITVHNQDISTGVVLISSVTTNQDGWVVLYRSPNFDTGDIVGYAPVYRGTNNDVKVTVDASKLTDQSTLWAQLHADAGILNVFEWGNSVRLPDGTSIQMFNDYPVVQNNSYIRASFATTASPAAAATSSSTIKNQISISNQALNTGVIVIDSVTAAQNGWVVIYRSPSLSAGDIVGYAPIYKGTNYGVKVTIDANKLTDQPPALWATLLADEGMPNEIVTGNRGRVLSELAGLPIVPNVIVGFGTNGP